MGDMLSWAIGVVTVVAGLAWVAGTAVVEWAAWMVVLPGRRKGELAGQLSFLYDPNSAGRRIGEPIEAIAADGVKLAGIWNSADEPTRHGRVVLLIHGFAEDPSTLLERMEILSHHGWDSASLDARAHGRSGGDRGSFGGREAADVGVWIDALTASGRLTQDSPVVAIWGRSMGAVIAMRAAVDDPRIAALVLEAPYLDLEDILRKILRRRRIPFKGMLARLIIRRAGQLAAVAVNDPRPIDVAPRVHARTLLVHGADDSLIPVSDAKRLAHAFPRPVPFLEVPGAGHNTVVEVGGKALIEQIAAFLDESVETRVRK